MKHVDAGTAAAIGLMVGLALGLVPLITGIVKRRVGMGVSAFVGCAVSGLFCGALLALPLAAGWTFWIWYRSDSRTVGGDGYAGLNEDDYRRERRRTRRDTDWDTPPPAGAGGPYTEIGTLVVCNRCQKATGKVNGEIPEECTHCGRGFLPRVPTARRARRSEPEEEIVDLWEADDRPRR